jgi:quercetin dioxygenase-like cupin family protein
MTEHRGEATRVVYVAPAEGEIVDVMGDVATFKLTSEVTGGTLILAEVATPPGGGPAALHTHPPREAFYVLEGEYEISGMGEDGSFTIRATPGSVVYVPPGAPHNFKNVGATTGRLLIVYNSPVMEAFPRELAVATAGHGPDNPPDPAKLMPVFTKFDIAFVGPSPDHE